MTRRLRILVTAFGPFPGVPLNPSQRTARDLLRLRRPALADVEIVFEILPTRWSVLPHLDTLMDEQAFDGVLLLGVAARRRHLGLEARAMNAARPFPDAQGRHPPGRRLAPRGPDDYRSTAPVLPWALALRRSGIPAAASGDAGRYLCNAAYFHALAAAQACARSKGAVPPVLFIHLPGRSGIPHGASRASLARGFSGLLVALAAEARRRRGRFRSDCPAT